MPLPVIYFVNGTLGVLPIGEIVQDKLDVRVSGIGHEANASGVRAHVEEVQDADEEVYRQSVIVFSDTSRLIQHETEVNIGLTVCMVV